MRATTIVLIIYLLTGFKPCFADQINYIDNSAYNKPTQSKVKFIHDSHNEKAGIDEGYSCHHLYEDGVIIESESSEDMPCSECHSPKMFKKKQRLLLRFIKTVKGAI